MNTKTTTIEIATKEVEELSKILRMPPEKAVNLAVARVTLQEKEVQPPHGAYTALYRGLCIDLKRLYVIDDDPDIINVINVKDPDGYPAKLRPATTQDLVAYLEGEEEVQLFMPGHKDMLVFGRYEYISLPPEKDSGERWLYDLLKREWEPTYFVRARLAAIRSM